MRVNRRILNEEERLWIRWLSALGFTDRLVARLSGRCVRTVMETRRAFGLPVNQETRETRSIAITRALRDHCGEDSFWGIRQKVRAAQVGYPTLPASQATVLAAMPWDTQLTVSELHERVAEVRAAQRWRRCSPSPDCLRTVLSSLTRAGLVMSTGLNAAPVSRGQPRVRYAITRRGLDLRKR